MIKERKTRNFDFLKTPLPELPSREEVIQKTVELTGQSSVEIPPLVPTVVEVPAEVPKPIKAKTVKKEPKSTQKAPKQAKKSTAAVPTEKSKVGRRALEDARKPFTSTITVDNKKRLRQLCAEYDIAMSDALNEMLSAQFENRAPKYKV